MGGAREGTECGRETVRKCKSAGGRCKGGKVNQITEYGVRSTDYRVEASTSGRDAVAPLPAGGARERQLGWHAVPTLPEAERKGDRGPGYLQAARVVSELSIRQTLTAIRLRQHAVPTLPTDGRMLGDADAHEGPETADAIGDGELQFGRHAVKDHVAGQPNQEVRE